MSVGPIEIVIVLALALLVFGPKQLPQMGRTLGRSLREFRNAADTARSALGLDDISAELGKVKSGFDDLKAGVDVKGALVGPPPTPAEPVATAEPAANPDTPSNTDGEAAVSEAAAAEVVDAKTPEAPGTDDDPLPGTSAVPGS